MAAGDDCPKCEDGKVRGKDCDACGGMGKQGKECPICKGNGWLDDPHDGGTMNCDNCDNNGFLIPDGDD